MEKLRRGKSTEVVRMIVGVVWLVLVVVVSGGAQEDDEATRAVQKYRELLFPSHREQAGFSPLRHLQDIDDPPDDLDGTICVICRGLEYCDALNGLLVQEKYYPEQNLELGTCSIIDGLGERMSNEIFGIGRTFRDTTQCRNIVLQYLCLFWGSQNDMYDNYCFWMEDVSSPNPDEHQIAPRPPCRSFCVQIAEVCANSADFLHMCNYIACPPTEDECTPDPVVANEVVAAGIGCDMPSLANPYSAAPHSKFSVVLLFTFVVGAVAILC